ncbi:MAG: cupin domain-containing protein [Caulobacteraceae bacterium]|nr:cupin domain-containing protein [Caulobacteraceae bacterium]
MAESKKALWRSSEIPAAMRPFTQKLNANSLFRAAGLSRLAGMSRAHVSLVKLPPGKDSFAYHAHMLEEEWIYIVSGRAMADIDGKTSKLAPATSWALRRRQCRICCATRSTKSAST